MVISLFGKAKSEKILKQIKQKQKLLLADLKYRITSGILILDYPFVLAYEADNVIPTYVKGRFKVPAFIKLADNVSVESLSNVNKYKVTLYQKEEIIAVIAFEELVSENSRIYGKKYLQFSDVDGIVI